MQSHPAVVNGAVSVSWFDAVILAWLIIGFFRGRKNGMSVELLLTMQWVAIVIAGALLYRPLGIPLAQSAGLSVEWAFRISYAVVAVMVAIVMGRARTMVGEKLVGADLFGKGEYILGMLSGVLRFACIALVFLALFGAHVPTQAEIASVNKKTSDLGNVSINPLKVQREIVVESLTGRLSRQYLQQALIISTGVAPSAPKETPAQKRERQVDEVMSPQITITPSK